ncbi:MAG: hypothetical protein ACO3PD_12425 [Acidimicrobiales bacterium]
MTSRRRHRLVAVTAVATLLMSVNTAAAQPSEASGLDRAREATMQSFDRAKEFAPGQANRARGLDEDRLRGLERAAEARAEVNENANGADAGNNGNALGREAEVGEEEHRGQVVRALAKARKAARPAGADD